MCQASSLSLIGPALRHENKAHRLSLVHEQPCPNMSPAGLCAGAKQSLQILRPIKMGLLLHAIKTIPNYITLT
jgi:hypothetical protein